MAARKYDVSLAEPYPENISQTAGSALPADVVVQIFYNDSIGDRQSVTTAVVNALFRLLDDLP